MTVLSIVPGIGTALVWIPAVAYLALDGGPERPCPEFSLAEVIQPYQTQIVKRRLSPQRLLRRAQRTYRDWDRLLDMLPRNLVDVLNRVQQGSFDVHLEHRRLDQVVNRLVLGILCAALFVASSLLWSFAAPPLVAGIPIFGAVGYGVAAWLGYRLLQAIRRSGNIIRRG